MTNPTESATAAGAATGDDPAPGRWLLDTERSSVTLGHKTMWGLVTVKGTFATIIGEAEILADGTGRGTLTIDAGSVDTKNAKRDKHLRSADFFEVDQYPSITFAASSATRGTDGVVQISGDLTVHGTTHPLAFAAQATEATSDAVTLAGTVDIDRTMFGLTWNQLGMMRGPATITLTARFTRQSE